MAYLSKADQNSIRAGLIAIASDFALATRKQQDFIIDKLCRWVTLDKRQIHKSKSGWFYLPSKERERYFRYAEKFHLSTKGLIEVNHTFSRKQRTTKAYKPTTEVVNLITRQLVSSMDQPKPLVDWNNKKLATPAPAIMSRDANNDKKKCKGNLPSLQPINRENVRKLLFTLQRDREQVASGHSSKLERVKRLDNADQIQVVDRLIASAQGVLYHSCYDGYEGLMPLYYREGTSSRIIGMGFNLQNAPRELKQAALAGCYDYDIVNCHINLLVQLGKREGVKVEQIEWYSELKGNKKRFQSFADNFGIDTDTLKAAMLAIVYGAGLVEFHGLAITELLSEQTSSFISHPDIKEFHRQVKNVRQAVTANADQRNGFLINHTGKKMPLTEKPDTLFAHLMQGYEAVMLHHALELYSDRITLLSHDGFAANDEIDISRITTKYKASTGLDIQIKRELITAPRIAA